MITYSIIDKSQLEGAHRLDTEYYQPEYLEIVKNLDKLKAVPIKEVAVNPKRKFRPKIGDAFRYIEISEITLLSTNVIKVRLHRSREQLKAVLKNILSEGK